ncbi:hypothetical protein D3867_37115 (plasmid) [Azospirillum argentinense]|uniref:Uncharacterized protein n=1 Tax=Azospirillum brasilense TaxID=192 RepID=A0A4D8QAW1_AZOBR|nr:hypothetical protein D3867_37115 [Azospirillum argentinense]
MLRQLAQQRQLDVDAVVISRPVAIAVVRAAYSAASFAGTRWWTGLCGGRRLTLAPELWESGRHVMEHKLSALGPGFTRDGVCFKS